MATLKLSFLGTPHIVLDDEPVEFSRRNALAILVYLALSRERQQRDTLATLLWPHSSQAHARQALRRDLSVLNRTLGGRWIDAERESVGLVSGYWLDVEQFEQALRTGATHPAARAEQLTLAAGLYRDDFLKGFTLAGCIEFDEWQFFQTERLRGAFASVLEQLAQTLIAQDEAEKALPYLRRRLALDSLHEPIHRQLIQLYAQVGQRAAALRQFELCRQILADEVGVEPEAETVALYRAVRDRTIASVESSRAPLELSVAPPVALPVTLPGISRHNLPAAATPFIGRRRELVDLSQLIRNPAVRLVTILGPGGMGKTRLALEAAQRTLDTHDNRVLFVPLVQLQSPEEVVSAIADAAGYTLLQDGRTVEEQLLDYLRTKQLLLLLDNTENLREGVDLIGAILQAAPAVQVLATSRERLQLSAETVFALGGMPFHQWEQWVTVEDALANDTVRLFVQSARYAAPGFQLSAQDVVPLARICRRVGGMPLAILLAAAWVDLLTLPEIADEIDRSHDLLTTQLRDVPERQRTIRAVFEYAWRKLGETERMILMKLAIFRGGFTRRAAQVVGGASLHTLSVLADKSLLQREPGGRYAIHELLRQYAEAELQRAGLAERVADAHSAYYTALLAQREGDLKGRGQKHALAEIEADLENIRLAWNWSTIRGDVARMAQALEGLGLFYEWHGRFQEGERAFARAAQRVEEMGSSHSWPLLSKARTWQARFSRGLGGERGARKWLPQTMMLLESVEPSEYDTRPERAAILKELGHLAYDAGERRAASSWYGQSLALYRELNDRWHQAKVLLAMESVLRNLHGLGSAGEHQRQAEVARQQVLESLVIFRDLEDQGNVAAALHTLGITLLTLGRPQEAQPIFQECIALCSELGTHGDTFVNAIGYLGVTEVMLGLYAEMRGHGQRVIALAEDVHSSPGLRVGYMLMGGAALGEAAYPQAEAWFSKSVAVSRQSGRMGQTAFGLTGWALASYWLGDRVTARQRLTEALRIAREIGTIRTAVHGTLLAALIQAELGEVQQAVELHTLAASFPFAGNSRWCQDVAGLHIQAATAALPPDVMATARARGLQRDVWTTVEELLALYAEDSSG